MDRKPDVKRERRIAKRERERERERCFSDAIDRIDQPLVERLSEK